MTGQHRPYSLIGLVLLAAVLAGCAGKSPKVSYYTLAPVAEAGVVAGEPLGIAVGPVAFPRSLDRTQIATRQGPNRVEFDDFHRWAGSLDSDFLRVAGVNLSRLLGTDRIVVYPAPPSFAIDYRILFDVVRFEADSGGSVTLEARWTLLEGESGDALDVGRFHTVRQSSGNDYAGRAGAHSAALGELCAAVAERIRQVPETAS